MTTRIPTMYGRYYVLSLVWRGREYDITVFRSKLQKLQRPQAQKIADSVYPGSRVVRYHESDPTEGPVVLATEEAPKGAKYDRMIKHIKKSYSKDGNLTKGEEGIAYATAWKHKNKKKNEEKKAPKGYHYMPDGKLMKDSDHKKKKKKEPTKGGSEDGAYPSTDNGTASMSAFNSYGEETSLAQAKRNIGRDPKKKTCWTGYKAKGTKMKDGRAVPNCVKEEDILEEKCPEGTKWCPECKKCMKVTCADKHKMKAESAWQRKEGKNKSGGLNEKGRKSYERENPGSDLKAPSKKKGNKRRASFCARMKGMKKKLTSKKTARDPDSRINKSLRAWNC